LLDHNVVLEMDGLSSSSDRAMFSEALTLYLYRLRLAEGPQAELTNLIVLEEAHHILARRATETKESVLETSIRMIRQYGIGYVFVDQSASLISKVAFANSYATLALSQKLRSDIQTMSGAMNLTEEQRDALSTLPIGSAVVRLADEHPEAFLVKIPRCPVREGSVSDSEIRVRMAAYSGESTANRPSAPKQPAISPIPAPDNIRKQTLEITGITHPPSPDEARSITGTAPIDQASRPPEQCFSREEIRFLADLIDRPLSTTVARYHRLHFSRRRGNAIRQSLQHAGLIEPVALATRSGQVMLCQLTEDGRAICTALGLAPSEPPRASLEHEYWAGQAARMFEQQGYEVAHEYHIAGDGFVDVVAERPGARVAVEIETGKSDIAGNLAKLRDAGFDRVVFVATSPAAVSACQRVIDKHGGVSRMPIELLTWLDVA
jgi:hypothetical protein